MKKVCAKMVPPILSDVQNQGQLGISSDLSCQLAGRNNFLDRFIMGGDESSCFECDPVMKCKSMQWKTEASPRLRSHTCCEPK
jgi:hypothetical protein